MQHQDEIQLGHAFLPRLSKPDAVVLPLYVCTYVYGCLSWPSLFPCLLNMHLLGLHVYTYDIELC